MSPGLFDETPQNTGVWRVGTSGWSYPPQSGPGSWTGLFYPPGRIDELRYYSRFFNTVEVNSTFYRPCNAKTAAQWVERTRDDFKFAIKLSRQFTHERTGWTIDDIDEFKAGIQPLAEAGKLAPVLLQFPASFRNTPGNAAYLESLLDLVSPYPSAVELRHISWDEYDLQALPVWIDEPKFPDSTESRLESRGRNTLYLRLHGRNAAKWWKHEHRNQRYDYLYSSSELRPIASRLGDIVTSEPIRAAYVFFNNHPDGKSVVNALMFRKELGIPVETEPPKGITERYREVIEG